LGRKGHFGGFGGCLMGLWGGDGIGGGLEVVRGRGWEMVDGLLSVQGGWRGEY